MPVDSATSTFNLPYTYADDGTYSIKATVTDDDGGTDAVASMKMTTQDVDNVTPNLIIRLDELTINEGETAVIQGLVADVGIDDEHTVTVDWDGPGLTYGDEVVTLVNGAFSATHNYDDDAPTATASDMYTITVKVVDPAVYEEWLAQAKIDFPA